MNWFLYLIKIFAFAFIIIILYNLLKIYVLSKFKPNKWVIFALAIAILSGPSMIKPGFNATIGGIFTSAAFVILILWFVDLFKEEWYEKKNKGKEVKIKPKAKPNRVKNGNNKTKKGEQKVNK